MADREYQPRKPPGTWRAALIGDSITAGQAAPPGRNYESLLEEHLGGVSACPDASRTEILNFAVGGYRSVPVMEQVLQDGAADFVSLARPFIREPELVRKIEAGWRGTADCVSCNICLMHEGVHSLRCWRESNRRLAEHAWYRLSGKVPAKLEP